MLWLSRRRRLRRLLRQRQLELERSSIAPAFVAPVRPYKIVFSRITKSGKATLATQAIPKPTVRRETERNHGVVGENSQLGPGRYLKCWCFIGREPTRIRRAAKARMFERIPELEQAAAVKFRRAARDLLAGFCRLRQRRIGKLHLHGGDRGHGKIAAIECMRDQRQRVCFGRNIDCRR